MAIFNFLENFFFISLAITFGLLLLLVYHFKERMSLVEKKSDTLNEVLTHVVKELKTIRFDMIQKDICKAQTIQGNTIDLDDENTKRLVNSIPPIVTQNVQTENISYVISDISTNDTLKSVVLPNVDVFPNKIIVSDESDLESDSGDSSPLESDTDSDSEYEQENMNDSEVEEVSESDLESSSSDEDEKEDEDNDKIENKVDMDINVQTDDVVSIGGVEEIKDNVLLVDELTFTAISNDEVTHVDNSQMEETHSVLPAVNNIIEEIVNTVSLPEPILDTGLTEESPSPQSYETQAQQPNINIKEQDESSALKESKNDIHTHDPKHVVYSKMSINQLRTIAISSGLATDTSKMKKAELIRLLKNLEEDESEEEE